ncbi:hypothetical protein BH09PAT3_BH09PAT3_0070 [soil metagenome]
MKKALFALIFGLVGFALLSFANPVHASAIVDDTPDCDSVSIIYCGARTLDELRSDYRANSYGDLGKVYGAFGISSNDLKDNSTFRNGIVWRDGRVTVDGNVVATGATTAGRWNNPTSDMTYISGTVRAYRMSTSHFVTEGQTAFVKFDSNGKFMFAVMKSCGNPVRANGIKPNFECSKLVAENQTRTRFTFTGRATNNRLADITEYTIKYGDGKTDSKRTDSNQITFGHNYAEEGTYTVRLTVTAKYKTNGSVHNDTSESCVTKVTVKPAPVFSCDSLTADKLNRTTYRFNAKAIAKNGAEVVKYTYDFGDGKKDVNQSDNRSNSVQHVYAEPGTYTARVTVTVKAEGDTKNVTSKDCVVKVPVAPVTPTYTCDSLTFTQQSRTAYNFVAKGSATETATIRDYSFDFGDNTTAVSTNGQTQHTYATTGTYTVKATANVVVNGAVVPTTSDLCKVTITVGEAPAYECTALTPTLLDAATMKYQYKLTYSATNGAALKTVNFDFGDGNSQNDVTPAELETITHSYAKPGTYTTTAALQFTIGDVVQEVKCSTPITIAACASNPEYPVGSPQCSEVPCAYNPQLPQNSPECKPAPCVYDSTLPKDSPECKPAVVAVTLPKTGAGSTIALFGAVTALAAAGHAFIARRRVV